MSLDQFLVNAAADDVLDGIPAGPVALDGLHATEFWARLKQRAPTVYADEIRAAMAEAGDVQMATLFSLAHSDQASAGRLAAQIFEAHAVAILTERREEREAMDYDEWQDELRADDLRERVQAVRS